MWTPATLRIVDLGTLDGVCCSHAAAINDNGEVVGDSDVAAGQRRAFRWRAGRMTELGTLGGSNSTAADINGDGDVVGFSDLPDGCTHAVLWRDGEIIDLGTLGGDRSYGTAISDAGEVVGYSETVSVASRLGAFSWRNGVMTALGTLRLAHDVDDLGAVVGVGSDGVPVRYRSGVTTPLTTRQGDATAINGRGQVTGFAFQRPGCQSFLWSGGRLIDLGAPPGSTFVQAVGINDRGEVVGSTDNHAFLWTRGTMTLLPRLGGDAGASDINNRGQVVGSSATTPDGLNPRAVLWTP